MRSTLITITLTAIAALAASGCTITVHSSDKPAEPNQAAAPSSPSRRAARPSYRTGSGTRPAATRPASSTGSGSASVPTDLAPRITSPIAFGNGTGGAFRGHAFVIPETTDKMPDFAALTPFATLFTDSFNVAPQRFAGGFPGALVQEEYFAIRYDGFISLPKDSVWKFKVTSDDGAILYIDGQPIVSNDGRHNATTATGERNLRAGRHALRLDYFQAAKGSVALVVNVVEDGKDKLVVGIK